MNLGITLIESAKLLVDNVFIHVVLLAIIFDVFTGLGKAVKQKGLNSSIGLNGLIRHLIIIFIVFVSTIYLTTFDLALYSNWINFYFIIMYIISLAENLDSIGIPLPAWVKNYLVKIHKSMNEQFKFTDVKSMDIKIEKKEK